MMFIIGIKKSNKQYGKFDNFTHIAYFQLAINYSAKVK